DLRHVCRNKSRKKMIGPPRACRADWSDRLRGQTCRDCRLLFLERHFLAFHRAAAALADHLRATADRADVAPVIQIADDALVDAVDLDGLQQLAAGQRPPGDAHWPIEDVLVGEEDARAIILD